MSASRRTILSAGLWIVVCTSWAAQAQTNTDIGSASAQENASAGSVAERAPGTWIRAAISRHNRILAYRLRGTGTDPEAEAANDGSSDAGSTSGMSGLADLLRLAAQSGQLGGSLATGGGLATGGRLATGGTLATGGGLVIPPPANGTSYTIQDLLSLASMAGQQKTSTRAQSSSEATGGTQRKTSGHSWKGQEFGGAIGRLTKPEVRYQSTDPNQMSDRFAREPSFGARWATAMLQTFFTSVAAAMQLPGFIEILQANIRPWFGLTAQEAVSSDAGDGTSINGSDGTGGATGGDSTGDTSTDAGGTGIEDLGAGENSGGGNSTL